MSELQFQERADGFRVVRITDAHEKMIVSVCTKRAIAAQTGPANPYGATIYKPLSRDEYTIHSAGGPLTIADIEEILSKLS